MQSPRVLEGAACGGELTKRRFLVDGRNDRPGFRQAESAAFLLLAGT